MTIRVVIVDDHTLVRRSLRMLLSQSSDIQVVGEADNGEDAIDLISNLQPDLVLLDVSMPRMNGISVTRRLMEMKIPALVLILSMFADASLAREALRLGARGYLLKTHISSELLPAIRQIKAGTPFFSAELKVTLGLG